MPKLKFYVVSNIILYTYTFLEVCRICFSNSLVMFETVWCFKLTRIKSFHPRFRLKEGKMDKGMSDYYRISMGVVKIYN